MRGTAVETPGVSLSENANARPASTSATEYGQQSGGGAASLFDLGDASGFSALAIDGNVSSSDSAFESGYIGVAAAGFQYTQSGGAETNMQQATTAFIHSGSWSGDHPYNVAINQSSDAFLQQAAVDASNASHTLASLAPTQFLGNVTQSTTVRETTAGSYVFDLMNINLNQASLTFKAPAGSTIVVNVLGSVSLNGGNQGNGLRLKGGITANDVIYNIVNGGSVTTTGGGNSEVVQGSILDVKGGVELHPGEVDGQVIGKYVSTSSGCAVISP